MIYTDIWYILIYDIYWYMIYTDIYPGWNYPGGPVQPFCSYDPLCAHFQSTKPSSQPKTVPYKMQWLLLFSCGKEHAFCSSPTFELFRGRNAFCSGVFWGSKFITRCARPHFIALGRWLMEFFLQINGFFHLMFQTMSCHVCHTPKPFCRHAAWRGDSCPGLRSSFCSGSLSLVLCTVFTALQTKFELCHAFISVN
jgi:hypothetical protein